MVDLDERLSSVQLVKCVISHDSHIIIIIILLGCDLIRAVFGENPRKGAVNIFFSKALSTIE